MLIRRATELDEATMRELWEEGDAEASHAPYPGQPFWPELLATRVVFVAEEDGRPVGSVYVNLTNPHAAYVFGLYVRPIARRRGVGRSLMLAAADAVRAEGRPYVQLTVDTPNVAARVLYEKLGFVDAARTLLIETDALLARDEPRHVGGDSSSSGRA
jgi:ribosomal protein S18 acetylase RimI-like enzyme